LKAKQRKIQPRRSFDGDIYEVRKDRGAVKSYAPVVFGGGMLVLAFAFTGYYMGQNAIAHNQMALDTSGKTPVTSLISKGSLLPGDDTMDLVNLKVLDKQTVMADGKGDYVDPVSAMTPQKSTLIGMRPPKVEVARLLPEPEQKPAAAKRIIITPTAEKIEDNVKPKRIVQAPVAKIPAPSRAEQQKAVAQRRVQLAEENCLARAVYFEARSESELGQLAVAKVILNRTRDTNYPKSICGVVYEGSNRRNSCQFSFACDGVPDEIRQPAAWANSKRIAQRAIAGDSSMKIMGAATNYHADYVRPRWAKNLRKVIKIGHHIFYTDS
jgi:spore germination cell wall hydrolase CwlJ-like protein